MKKFIKFIITLSLLLIIPLNIKAENTVEIISNSNMEYTVDIKTYDNNKNELTSVFYVDDKLSNYSVKTTTFKGNISLPSYSRWEDIDYIIKEGNQVVNIITKTPIDREFIIQVNIFGIKNTNKPIVIEDDEQYSISEINMFNSVESFSTSLTANTIVLNQDSSYDINLVDKVSGATYEWLSSDSKIAKVDKKGIVTAVKEGKAKITCKVTTPEKQSYELTADVVVGTDDNFPILTDTELTLEVGDLYDIDVDNIVKGSKIKFTASDKSIAKVVSSNGKVTAIKNGEATIYCTITVPKTKEVIVLSCKLNIE